MSDALDLISSLEGIFESHALAFVPPQAAEIRSPATSAEPGESFVPLRGLRWTLRSGAYAGTLVEVRRDGAPTGAVHFRRVRGAYAAGFVDTLLGQASYGMTPGVPGAQRLLRDDRHAVNLRELAVRVASPGRLSPAGLPGEPVTADDVHARMLECIEHALVEHDGMSDVAALAQIWLRQGRGYLRGFDILTLEGMLPFAFAPSGSVDAWVRDDPVRAARRAPDRARRPGA
ncbi:hypothetical protein [Deinococcus soli (ex Cha et al. 2016)]|uniref:Uncharacterized protein n=2 Tax=Deinococcus soli (ex Cha et al. 2016) TaxID=1309411 RepID=A0AAE4BL98_9DEIO|nr:hypothetical protein [Deinococcus soli (ex Cha et al. 2016)]MDR6218718.1 hypothetical protein [Deinococcus soli (ex Cha et al. 2016)]MDR6328515.1 hypothetical protein [Deinococcus soli (ex Cha et al. 2016)]MDR6753126.1 hypothetical protein [Deinococcus soli (ex Cha et al. 2016)]